MTVTMHAWGPFALFTAFTGCATVWVFFAFPECKGRSMESVGAIFSLPWYRTGFSKVPAGQDEQENRDLEKEAASSTHEENSGKA
jgi:hypothetical protein